MIGESKDEARRNFLDVDAIAYRAAKDASKEVFAQLGVNVEDPTQVEEFRRDLRFGGQLRKAADKSFVAFIMTGIFAMGLATLMYFLGKFKG